MIEAFSRSSAPISGYGKMRSSAITPWKSAFKKLCSNREVISGQSFRLCGRVKTRADKALYTADPQPARAASKLGSLGRCERECAARSRGERGLLVLVVPELPDLDRRRAREGVALHARHIVGFVGRSLGLRRRPG